METLTELDHQHWWVICGLGAIWFGGLIVWVAPKPSQLGGAPKAQEPVDAAAKFQRFWLDQYAWIGISSTAIGLLSATYGLLT